MSKLLAFTCLLIISSCAKEIPISDLVDRQGIAYEVNTTTPFTGVSLSYHFNEQLKLRYNYKDGKFDGVQEDFFSNGQLETIRNFKEGFLEGLQEVYYKNGQLNNTGNFKDGKKAGLWESYFEDGQIHSKSNWKDEEEINATTFKYFENGQLEEKVNYKDGELDGPTESYYENGQLRVRTSFINGINSLFETFYEDGKVREVLPYKDGRQDGINRIYYPNGKLTWEDTFIKGRKIESIYYDETGQRSYVPFLNRHPWFKRRDTVNTASTDTISDVMEDALESERDLFEILETFKKSDGYNDQGTYESTLIMCRKEKGEKLYETLNSEKCNKYTTRTYRWKLEGKKLTLHDGFKGVFHPEKDYIEGTHIEFKKGVWYAVRSIHDVSRLMCSKRIKYTEELWCKNLPSSWSYQ
jgi:antitoxin component YwqK of YwqJK toxin-antitoxin module